MQFGRWAVLAETVGPPPRRGARVQPAVATEEGLPPAHNSSFKE